MYEPRDTPLWASWLYRPVELRIDVSRFHPSNSKANAPPSTIASTRPATGSMACPRSLCPTPVLPSATAAPMASSMSMSKTSWSTALRALPSSTA
ncbi:hypothetical protein ACFODQ_02920 [Comamonas sp. JC664]